MSPTAQLYAAALLFVWGLRLERRGHAGTGIKAAAISFVGCAVIYFACDIVVSVLREVTR